MTTETEEKGAIGIHHTDTSNGSWDGPQAKSNLKLNQGAAYYKRAFAWMDSQGDQKKKESYKFIHHEVSSDGTIGAANLRACSSGIAVLNGGRGGSNIPDGDKQGVWNHLAAHIKDSGADAPPMKEFDPDEVKYFHARITKSKAQADGHLVVEGFASTPNLDRDSEVIQPATFEASAKDYLAHNPILMYRHHEPVGSVTDISFDSVAGVWIKAFLSKAAGVADVVTMVKEGVLRAFSVGFIPKEFKDLGDGNREITALEWLETSIVPIPSNRQSLFSIAKALRYGTDMFVHESEVDVEGISQRVFEQTMERIKTASVAVEKDGEPALELNHNSPAYREFNLAMAEITKALEAEKAARAKTVQDEFRRTLNISKE